MAKDYKFRIIGKDATKAAFASIKSGLSGVRSGINSTAAQVVAFAGPAGMGLLIQSTLDAVTEQTRLAHSLGISTEALSEWTHAASTVNIEGDKMADIFKDVQDKIGDFARTGGGGAADMFEQINLNVNDLIDLAPDQQLLRIGKALDDVGSRSEKIFFLEALAGDASLLLPLLEDNAAGLNELAQEARDLGVSISEVDAAKMEEAKRSLERVKASASGIANKLTVALAPIISTVAEKFLAAGAEGDRMGKIVDKAISFMVRGVGIFADGLRGIEALWVGLRIGANAFSAGILMVFESLVSGAISGANALIKFILTPLRTGLELAAKFSDGAKEALESLNEFTNIEPPDFLDTLRDKMDGFANDASEARGELHELLMADLPSSVIEGKWQEIQAEAQRRAEEVAAIVEAEMTQGGGGKVVTSGETEAEKIARLKAEQIEKDKIAVALARMDTKHFTELEKIQARQDEETRIITEALAVRLVTEEEAAARQLKTDKAAAEARELLERKSARAKLGMITGSLGMIANMQNTKSKKLFKVQKAAALAQAAVALPAAVLDSYRNAGGYPFGIIPAAAMAAAGIAEIQNIKKTSFNGGGSAGSSSGRAGSGAGITTGFGVNQRTTFDLNDGVGSQFGNGQTYNPNGNQNVTHIHVAGDIVGDGAEVMLNRIKEMINQGDQVLFDANSRQAQELTGGGGA